MRPVRRARRSLLSFIGSLLILGGLLPVGLVSADSTAQSLPFAQDWTNTALITTTDDWSGVPGITGYRGDALVAASGADPQTVVADGAGTPVDVNANQVTPNTFATGGVSEFHITDPVVALQGSGTADAPHLVISIDTTGASGVNVAYNLRDIDGSADNAVQPVALQYRVGTSGNYTNVPAAFVADASTGPSLATLVTPVSVALPASTANQPVVELRIITTDAAGSDEWVGIDDIAITGTAGDQPPTVIDTTPDDGATNVATNTPISVTFSEDVTASAGAFTLECDEDDVVVQYEVNTAQSAYSLVYLPPLPQGALCTVTVHAELIHDVDGTPDPMAADFAFSFATFEPVVVSTDVKVSQVYGGGGNSGATYTNDFIELFNRGETAVSLSGWSVQYASSAGSSWQVTPLTGSIPAGRHYLVQEAAGAGGIAPLPTPDATGSIAMSATSGKVALVASTTALTGTCPTGGSIADLVGYGPANCFEGTGPTAAPANATAALRKDDGATDTNDNAADFAIGDPNPRATVDSPPRVLTTFPASNGTGAPKWASVILNFNEPVDVTGSWFSIGCTATGDHTPVVSGGPVSFSLNPDALFAAGETCTVTAFAENVTDQDGDDPPENMVANHVFTFIVAADLVCGTSATFIHQVQGAGTASPMNNAIVEIEGVVVGAFPGSNGFQGLHVQEEDAHHDVNPATSEGIFVFEPNGGATYAVGDLVRVKGRVTEFGSASATLTQLTNLNNLDVCSSGHAVTPAPVALPFPSPTHAERWEGMLVDLDQELTVTETFGLGRFGEIVLSSGGRLLNPTNVVEPGAPSIALQAENDLRRIVLDDGDNRQNLDPTLYPTGGLSAVNTLRVGDTSAGGTFVLEQRFGLYRLQPTATLPTFQPANPRPAEPDHVGGTLRVASMNVLNYFTTLDTNPGSGNGPDICGPAATLECRGASTAFELDRQRAKILSALLGLDAHVVGLMEIENNDHDAVADLVDGLNEILGAGTYAYVDTGTIGTDAIKVALIYRPAMVQPVGEHAILDSAVDPRFDDTLNRPTLAQTFDAVAGGRFTVVVNHLKSKGSACPGDPDTSDGQGNCNLTRVAAAEALVDWLASDPTASGDRDTLVIGDLNSYAKEDPIDVFEDAGYVNTIRQFVGEEAYSFVFQGQSGYLDHALASPSLALQVTGTTEWHVNADEPTVLDYNVDFKTENHVETLFAPDAYRSSDHDPVLVGLQLLRFDGFRPPIKSPPAMNTAKAGSTIPMKFDLGADFGLDILLGQPQVYACSAWPDGPSIDAESPAGFTFSFDPTTREYLFEWRTARAWRNGCRTFEVTFVDGTIATADVSFR